MGIRLLFYFQLLHFGAKPLHSLWLFLFKVDSSETLSDSDGDGKALTEVHSIGVQVEDDKR